MSHATELEQILIDNEERLDAFAEKVRKEVVKPFCKKYGFTYMSGNGTYVFYKADKQYSSTYFLPEGAAGIAMKEIFRLLDTPAGRFELGHYVGDVD